MNIGTKYSVGSHSQIYFQWEEQSQDLAKGVTVVKWQLVLKADAYGAIDSSKKKSYSVKVDGQTYQGTNTIGISNNQSKILAQGTTSMVHDANGNKTFNYSFKQEFGFYSQSLKKQIDFVEGSGSGTLSQIKLYPVITSAPNFAFGDKPTITFDLKGYDYTKVAVCISLTKAKSDISYRYILANTNQYTFNLTEDDYQILNQNLTSRSRTVYFFIRTTIGKDSEGNDIYTRSYVPVTYTCKGAISIINDKKLWVDCTSFRRKNSTGIHKFLPDDSVSLCVDMMDFLYIAFDYEHNLNFYGRTVGTKIDIEFHGKKLRYTLGDNCSSVPSDIYDYTQTILQPWDSEMFANKSSITDYLRITFYNDFGDKVVTQRLIRVIKYTPPTFKATVSRLTDTTAQILFNVECSQIKYSTSVNGAELTNAIEGINIDSAKTGSNTVDVSNIVNTPIIKDNLITINIKNITSGSYIINGDIIDGIGEETDFTIIIPPVQRPLNINTQAVAIGDMIDNKENDGRFKCGWDSYFTGAIHHKYPELLYTYDTAAYFKADHYFTLSDKKALANQPNGYLIEWCYIEKSDKGGYDRYTNSGLNYTFIPRCIPTPPSNGHISLSFPLCDYFRPSGVKGVLVTTHTSTETTIKGVNENGNSPNNQWAIYRVFGI